MARNHRSYLPNLIRFSLAARLLQVDQLFNAWPHKNVVPPAAPLFEPQIEKKLSQLIEADVGIAPTSEDSKQ